MRSLLVALLALAATAFPSNATTVEPVGPVLNGDFELAASLNLPAGLTPLETCYGFGHQVLYGSDSWQYKLVEGTNPEGAAMQLLADPQGEAEYLSGAGHCVWGSQEGYDLVWLTPAKYANKALHWSTEGSYPNVVVGDFTSDGDKEIRIGNTPAAGYHSLWQAWPSPHQAWMADFVALSVRVEQGAIPASAFVQLSLASAPQHDASPYVGVFIDCSLTIPASSFVLGADGRYHADPTTGSFAASWEGCNEEAAAFNAPGATRGDKYAVLGDLRIVQNSWWYWNTGATPVVLDDIAMTGARTVAEALAEGSP